mmetsp:Transcript_4347/g.19777  ORF Transcript_4347/g.19777 Transcript_4347/m.19777 type:complete len:300 (-) Transcript_4347:974-1873(-)
MSHVLVEVRADGDARRRGVEEMREAHLLQVLPRCRLRSQRLEPKLFKRRLRRRALPHARALIHRLLAEWGVVVVLQLRSVLTVDMCVPVYAAHHELLVPPDGFNPALHDDYAEGLGDEAHARQPVLLRVDVHPELILRVGKGLHPVHVHLRLHAPGRVVEELTNLPFPSLRGGELPGQVSIFVRRRPLLHLLPHLLLDRRGIRGGLVREHPHQVGDLNLRLRGFQQTLADHLLLLLLALLPPLRPQLLLLALRELQGLRRRRRRLHRRLHRHRVLDVEVDLLRLNLPFTVRDVVVSAVL